MELFNDTLLTAALFPGSTPTGGGATMVVKGAFDLTEPNALRTLERPALSGDVAWEEEGIPGCRYPSDFAPFKPATDLLVLATITTGELPVRRVELRAGSFAKLVDVKTVNAGRRIATMLPLSPLDAERLAKSGTYDALWRATRWPWFPADFDWSLFQAAPVDQRIAGYLLGDEIVQLNGLSDSGFKVRLPGLRPRGFVRRGGTTTEEVELKLDTLWLDVDAAELVLVWRGNLPGRIDERTQALLAVESLSEQPLRAEDYEADTKWTRSRNVPEVNDGVEGSAADVSAATAVPRAKVEAPSAREAETLAHCLDVMREAKFAPELLERAANASSLGAMVALLDAEFPAPDAPAFDDSAQREMARQFLIENGQDPSFLDGPPPKDESPPAEQEGALTREDVVATVARGGSLEGADLRGLDLSKLELKGANLRGACLEDSDLSGTSLVGADLSGAVLRKARAEGAVFDSVKAMEATFDGLAANGATFLRANLARASMASAALSGACFDGADLTGAKLPAVNLEGASLAGADASDANLQLAVLRGATLTKGSLRCADLTGACLDRAKLDGVDLTGACVSKASAAEASLVEARLEGARGEDASFARSDLTRVRAGIGCELPRADLREVRADGAALSGANLQGAKLEGASLVRASFRGAQLDGASFHLAKLQHADFSDARLVGALLTKVNALRGLLPRVDLTSADCRGSNFFECEFWDANVAGARFEGSNLERTKLAAEEAKS